MKSLLNFSILFLNVQIILSYPHVLKNTSYGFRFNKSIKISESDFDSLKLSSNLKAISYLDEITEAKNNLNIQELEHLKISGMVKHMEPYSVIVVRKMVEDGSELSDDMEYFYYSGNKIISLRVFTDNCDNNNSFELCQVFDDGYYLRFSVDCETNFRYTINDKKLENRDVESLKSQKMEFEKM